MRERERRRNEGGLYHRIIRITKLPRLTRCIWRAYFSAQARDVCKWSGICARAHRNASTGSSVREERYTDANDAVFQRRKKYIITDARIPSIRGFNGILVSGSIAACLRLDAHRFLPPPPPLSLSISLTRSHSHEIYSLPCALPSLPLSRSTSPF